MLELDVMYVLFITFIVVFPLIHIILSAFMLNSYVILSSSVLIIMRSFRNSSQLAPGMISQYIMLMANSFDVYGYIEQQRRTTVSKLLHCKNRSR